MKGTFDGGATDPVIAAKSHAQPEALVDDSSWTEWGNAVLAPIETRAPK